MTKDIKEIVIVGGGTAGWISALFFSRVQKEQYNVTVIEPSTIPIIGVGESTSGRIQDLLKGKYFSIETSPQDFLNKTDTLKRYGIRYKNWNNSNSDFIIPFDNPTKYYPKSNVGKFDHFIYAYEKYGASSIHKATFMGQAFEYNVDLDTSGFHSDAHDMAMFFKKIALNKKNVKYIDAVVKEISLNQNGFIESLTLNDDLKISGDLFVDCSGFKRVLINKMEMGWESYDKHIPTNSVLTFRTPSESSPKTLTTSTALSAGWMFNIPVKNRIGNGYVYDNNFISAGEAKLEVEKFLKTEINPGKTMSWSNGRLKKFWNKNCIAFGISSFFVDPLTGSSITTTINQLDTFTKQFLQNSFEKTFNELNEKVYNNICIKQSEMYLDVSNLMFIGKNDNALFWQKCSKKEFMTDRVSDFIEMFNHTIPLNEAYGLDYYDNLYSFFLQISLGKELISKEVARKSLENKGVYNQVRDAYESLNKEFYKAYYVLPEDREKYELQKGVPYGTLISNYKQRRKIWA